MNFQRLPLSTWAGLKRTNHFLEAKFHRIHVLQIISSNISQSSAPAALLVHGAISNGNIFYSNKSGLGLGPYLARHGFNVFCVDLRGKGLSLPKLSEERVAHGLTEIICDTIPLVSEFVCEQSQQEKQSWISHSYGGVLLTSSMVRFPEVARRVSCQVHFGAKRTIYETQSLEYLKQVFFGWNIFCPLLAKFYGYVPAVKYKFGSDDETLKFVTQSRQWLKAGSAWVDSDDGFDYGEKCISLIRRGAVPPAWHFAGKGDSVLGHPLDVQRWAIESGQTTKFTLLSKENGFKEDYNHTSMLVSKNCDSDVFVEIPNWILHHSRS